MKTPSNLDGVFQLGQYYSLFITNKAILFISTDKWYGYFWGDFLADGLCAVIRGLIVHANAYLDSYRHAYIDENESPPRMKLA